MKEVSSWWISVESKWCTL